MTKSKSFICCFLAARENRELDILIFREVLENIARVDRVLTKPGGSLLLAGRSGVGRRTAVTLVTHMHNITLVTPKVSRGYGLKHFKNDLKTVRKFATSSQRQFEPTFLGVTLRSNPLYILENTFVQLSGRECLLPCTNTLLEEIT